MSRLSSTHSACGCLSVVWLPKICRASVCPPSAWLILLMTPTEPASDIGEPIVSGVVLVKMLATYMSSVDSFKYRPCAKLSVVPSLAERSQTGMCASGA